jgi:hypothetical protein
MLCFTDTQVRFLPSKFVQNHFHFRIYSESNELRSLILQKIHAWVVTKEYTKAGAYNINDK